jgi:hypothetical protein
MQSRFSLLSLFYFVNEKEALPTRAMVVLCVFITLKPGSRKAEEEEEKKGKYSPQTDLVSCTSFFFSLLFFSSFPLQTVAGEIKTPYLSFHHCRQV